MDLEELKKKMVQRNAGLSLSASKLPPPPPPQSLKPKDSPPTPQSPPLSKPQSNFDEKNPPRSPGTGRMMSMQIPKSVIQNAFKASAPAPFLPSSRRSTSDPKDLKEMSDAINRAEGRNSKIIDNAFELEAETSKIVSFGDFSVGLQKIFGNDSSTEFCFTSSKDSSVFIKGSSDVFPLGDHCFLPIYLYALEVLKPDRVTKITGSDYNAKDQHFIPSESLSNPLTPGGSAALLVDLIKDKNVLEKILDIMCDASGSRISCSLPRFFELEDSEMYSKLSALLHHLVSLL
eukprot:TRINITY_DN2395_c0_g2_i2.p1 TRINITY_DN2395_c0_g2~~TRINITY_DN2395_c0_g2_i2.p1  ORF type:complete len:289 (-),score=76.43 TRINITY_DN2395_c0_g2_i2:42-908(-)